MTRRYPPDHPKLTPFEQRIFEPMGLQADGTIEVYTPEEAKLRMAETKFNWQRGYDHAIAGRPMEQTSDGLIEVNYGQGYLEGEEKRLSRTGRPSVDQSK